MSLLWRRRQCRKLATDKPRLVFTMLAALLLVTSTALSGLPAAVWPPPLSAECTTGDGPAISTAVAIAFGGAGGATSTALQAAARYTPLLTAHGNPGAGGVAKIAVIVSSANEALNQATDYSCVPPLSPPPPFYFPFLAHRGDRWPGMVLGGHRGEKLHRHYGSADCCFSYSSRTQQLRSSGGAPRPA